MTDLPKWLDSIVYGLSEHHKFRVLLDGETHAIVQIPGGAFLNGQVREYGVTMFYLVDKNAAMRRGVGLLDCEVLQSGGRASWLSGVLVSRKRTARNERNYYPYFGRRYKLK